MTLNSGSTVYFIFWSFDNNLSSRFTRSQVSWNRNLKSLATCAANNACKDREIAKLDCWLIILYFLLVCLFVLCFLNLFIFVLHKVNFTKVHSYKILCLLSAIYIWETGRGLFAVSEIISWLYFYIYISFCLCEESISPTFFVQSSQTEY